MNNQGQLDFTVNDIEYMIERAKEHEHDGDHIVIGGVGYPRTPDPDRARRLIPPDKPIVLYCKTRYYLINSAKLQMVDQLTCIVGIRRKIGKQLLLTSQNKEAEE